MKFLSGTLINCLIEVCRLTLTISRAKKKLKPYNSFDVKTDDECIIQVDHAK